MASVQQLVSPHLEVVASVPSVPLVPNRRQWVRYLLWAAVLPAMFWVAAFPLVCSRSYENWGETEWGPVLEFPYEPGTPDADVVVWGDSSAFLGIDPRLVNAQLGIRSVVLPSTVGSLPVIGDEPLRDYLAHHRKPRLIVLYFTAWNLDVAHAAPGRVFEGEEMLLRHGRREEVLRYALRHPIEVIAFPFRLYSTFGSKLITEALHHQSRAHDAATSLGHAPFLEPYGQLPDACRIPSAYLQQRGTGSIEAFRRRYTSPGTDVMVYLAPIPHCSNSGSVRSRSFAAVGAAPPKLLPAPDFAGDPYYAHVLPQFVPLSSSMFAEALRVRLQGLDPGMLSRGAPAPVTR